MQKKAQVTRPWSIAAQREASETASSVSTEKLSDTLQLDLIRLEIGYNLLPLVNSQKGQRLTEQIKALRKQIAKDYGFVLPSVRIQDNMQLDNDSYVIKIKELVVGRGNVRIGKLMVMDPKGNSIEIAGKILRNLRLVWQPSGLMRVIKKKRYFIIIL